MLVGAKRGRGESKKVYEYYTVVLLSLILNLFESSTLMQRKNIPVPRDMQEMMG